MTVTNTGPAPGKQVVQVYASRPDSAIERPVRWLVGFAPVSADAGSTATADDLDPGPGLRRLVVRTAAGTTSPDSSTCMPAPASAGSPSSQR